MSGGFERILFVRSQRISRWLLFSRVVTALVEYTNISSVGARKDGWQPVAPAWVFTPIYRAGAFLMQKASAFLRKRNVCEEG